MRKTIAIGMLGLALVANRAAAQTAVEQAQILRDFQRSVVDYTQRDKCLLFPEAIDRRSARTEDLHAAGGDGLPSTDCAGVDRTGRCGDRAPATHRAVRCCPSRQLSSMTSRTARRVLPLLPAPLEYRLIDHDLVIRDADADVIVAVLRDAIGTITTRR